MIEIEDTTEEEKKAIDALKRKMELEMPPFLLQDKSLWYRFLKARDFDLKKAEAMIRKHISDFNYYKIEELTMNYVPPKGIYYCFDFPFIGYDKEGCPAQYAEAGRGDFKGILSAFTKYQIYQYVVALTQENIGRLTKQSKKLGKVLTTLTFILNFEDFSLYQASHKEALETYYEGFRLFQDNYPERIKAVYIINASMYFHIAFSVLKAVLSNVLLKKIYIFGNDGYKEALLEQFDADVLPAFLGGNRTDPDGNPNCNTFILHAQKVPLELYRKNSKSKKTLAHLDGVKKLSLRRSSYSEIMVEILEEDSRIEWEFETESKDIGFGLFYRDNSKSETVMEELVPLGRVDTMLEAETGLYICHKTGTYVIVFDNSYSWIRSKKLYYRIRVLKPNAETYDDY